MHAIVVVDAAIDVLEADRRAGAIDHYCRVRLWRQTEGSKPGNFVGVVGSHIVAIEKFGPETSENGWLVAVEDDLVDHTHLFFSFVIMTILLLGKCGKFRALLCLLDRRLRPERRSYC